MDEVALVLNLFKGNDRIRQLQPEESIFKKGEPGDCMYVIKQGNARVEVEGTTVEILNDGDIVGEMALMDGSPRSADCIAVTACLVVPVDIDHFYSLVQEAPFFAVYIMRTLTRRLRQTEHARAAAIAQAQAQAAAAPAPDMPPDLQAIADRWANLPEHMKHLIIEAATTA